MRNSDRLWPRMQYAWQNYEVIHLVVVWEPGLQPCKVPVSPELWIGEVRRLLVAICRGVEENGGSVDLAT